MFVLHLFAITNWCKAHGIGSQLKNLKTFTLPFTRVRSIEVWLYWNSVLGEMWAGVGWGSEPRTPGYSPGWRRGTGA